MLKRTLPIKPPKVLELLAIRLMILLGGRVCSFFPLLFIAKSQYQLLSVVCIAHDNNGLLLL